MFLKKKKSKMHNHHPLSVKLLLSLLDLSNYMCLFLGNEGTKIQDILFGISPT